MRQCYTVPHTVASITRAPGAITAPSVIFGSLADAGTLADDARNDLCIARSTTTCSSSTLRATRARPESTVQWSDTHSIRANNCAGAVSAFGSVLHSRCSIASAIVAVRKSTTVRFREKIASLCARRTTDRY